MLLNSEYSILCIRTLFRTANCPILNKSPRLEEKYSWALRDSLQISCVSLHLHTPCCPHSDTEGAQGFLYPPLQCVMFLHITDDHDKGHSSKENKNQDAKAQAPLFLLTHPPSSEHVLSTYSPSSFTWPLFPIHLRLHNRCLYTHTKKTPHYIHTASFPKLRQGSGM